MIRKHHLFCCWFDRVVIRHIMAILKILNVITTSPSAEKEFYTRATVQYIYIYIDMNLKIT